jgi:elongation factor P
MATTNDIKNGSVLSLDGQLWAVVEFQHVKPGKGGCFCSHQNEERALGQSG